MAANGRFTTLMLRIFFGEDERSGHKPLYEAIVSKAREKHLAGATVLRGPMGFGHSSRIHTTKIEDLSENLPIVVEIVDSEEKITGFLSELDGMIGGGLVTIEKVKVLPSLRNPSLHRLTRRAWIDDPFFDTSLEVIFCQTRHKVERCE